jgi:hypothetical protein
VTSAAAAPVVVRRSVDRAVANRRIEPAVTRILHEIPKPRSTAHTLIDFPQTALGRPAAQEEERE